MQGRARTVMPMQPGPANDLVRGVVRGEAEIQQMTLEIERGVERQAEERVLDEQRAIDQRDEVEVVHDAAARRLSETCSGIGDLLRFGQI